MIFPLPYTKGTKIYPILGVSSTFYNSVGEWATGISNHLSNSGGSAAVLSNLSGNYYSINRVADVFILRWAYYFNPLLFGFPYVLIPKLTSYPTYSYYGDADSVEDAINNNLIGDKLLFDLLQADPGDGVSGIPIWYVQDNFSYDGKLYKLYCIKYLTSRWNTNGDPDASLFADTAIAEYDNYFEPK